MKQAFLNRLFKKFSKTPQYRYYKNFWGLYKVDSNKVVSIGKNLYGIGNPKETFVEVI